MAITVQASCSDCNQSFEKTLTANDKEIVCPECGRNMPTVTSEEYKSIEKTQGGQRLFGILSLVFVAGIIVLLVFWAGQPHAWASTDDKQLLAKFPREDTTMFLAGAGVCMVLAMVLGVLASRKRYIVEF